MYNYVQPVVAVLFTVAIRTRHLRIHQGRSRAVRLRRGYGW